MHEAILMIEKQFFVTTRLSSVALSGFFYFLWFRYHLFCFIFVDSAPPSENISVATERYLAIAKDASRNGDYSTAITQYESVYAMYNTTVGPLHTIP